MECKTKPLNFNRQLSTFLALKMIHKNLLQVHHLAVSLTLQTDPTPYTWQVVQISSVFNGLGNRWTRFLCPAGLRDIFLIHKNQADSGVHPASYEPNTGGASTGGKAAGPRSCHLYPSSPRPRFSVAILPLSNTCSPRLITHGDFTLLTHYDMDVQTATREVVVWGPRPHL